MLPLRLPRCPHCGRAVEEDSDGQVLHIDTLVAPCDPALYEAVLVGATARRRKKTTRRQAYISAGGTFALRLPSAP